jgi:hypothetical protein
MGIFNKEMTKTDQGNIGLSKAIYELQLLGYRISIPLTENQKYDLIGEKNGLLFKIQIKTTRNKSRYGVYSVNLRTLGGNKSSNKVIKRNKGDYDLLYVLTNDNESYLIDEENIGDNVNSLNLSKQFLKFKINV